MSVVGGLETWVLVSTLSLISSMNLGRPLALFGLQFPALKVRQWGWILPQAVLSVLRNL